MNTTFPILQILITTVSKNHDEMLALYKQNKICGNAIIRSQCGASSTRETTIDGFKVVTIEAEDIGVSRNRNMLMREATAKFIIFLDDDFTLSPNFSHNFETISSTYESDVFFVNRVEDSKNRKPWFKKARRIKHLNNKILSHGANNFIFKRNKLIQSGITFNERIGPGNYIYGGEDTIFLNNIKKNRRFIFYSAGQLISMENKNDKSTWFTGYDERYFFVKGFIYTYLHPHLWSIYLIRFCIKLFNTGKNKIDISFIDSIKQGLLGHKKAITNNKKRHV